MEIIYLECPECGAEFPCADNESFGTCPDCDCEVTNEHFKGGN